jgi:hypothetical protein
MLSPNASATPMRRLPEISGLPALTDHRNRQAKDGAHMQRKLGQILRNQRDQAGVVGPRRDFAENHFLATDKQLHPENAAAAQGRGDFLGDLLCHLQH